MDTLTAIKIYNTIIKPHFEYCATILYTCCNQAQIGRIQKLQNKCMRCILKCGKYTPIRTMLETLKWLTIEQRLKLNTLLMIFKIKHNLAPRYLTNCIQYVRNTHQYFVRNANDFRLELQRTTTAQNTLLYKGLYLFNSLPEAVKTENNILNFKRLCIDFLRC